MKILGEISDDLAALEDVTHGEIGYSITRIRSKISSAQFQFSEEERSRVLGLVYAEAISGDLSQDQFFKLTEDQKQAFRDANGTVSNQ